MSEKKQAMAIANEGALVSASDTMVERIIMAASDLGGAVSNEVTEAAEWFDDSCENNGGGTGTGGDLAAAHQVPGKARTVAAVKNTGDHLERVGFAGVLYSRQCRHPPWKKSGLLRRRQVPCLGNNPFAWLSVTGGMKR